MNLQVCMYYDDIWTARGPKLHEGPPADVATDALLLLGPQAYAQHWPFVGSFSFGSLFYVYLRSGQLLNWGILWCFSMFASLSYSILTPSERERDGCVRIYIYRHMENHEKQKQNNTTMKKQVTNKTNQHKCPSANP